MDDTGLFYGLEKSEDSVYKSANSSEQSKRIKELLDSTFEKLRINEIKEAESIENALNDFSLNI